MTVGLEWVETGQFFPLVAGRSLVIGRGKDADIYLGLAAVGRQHCQVHWDGCHVWVHDLASRCGTYINGEHARDGVPVVEPAGSLLRLGDVLRSGPVRLRLRTASRIEPSWLTWQGGLVVSMARWMYESRDFSDMPILADALEDAGCPNQDILAHCRSGGDHERGCWVVDVLLAPNGFSGSDG